MSTKREAAVEGLMSVVRMVLGNSEFREKHGYSVGLLEAALRDLHAAPDDVEAVREERTEAQGTVALLENPDPNRPTMFTMDARLLAYLRAIRDDLRALAAAVKERR